MVHKKPVEKGNIKGNKYYTCNYGGTPKVTILKIFDDAVLVKANNKPFVRKAKYIFENIDMARHAMRNWEHDERKRKRTQ